MKGIRKFGPTTVHTPSRPSFVYGSKPPAIRNPRIKPASPSTNQYGKNTTEPSAKGVSGAGFGTTGVTGDY